MADSATVVREFFELMEARRWGDAEARVAADADIRFTETGERFRGTVGAVEHVLDEASKATRGRG